MLEDLGGGEGGKTGKTGPFASGQLIGWPRAKKKKRKKTPRTQMKGRTKIDCEKGTKKKE